MKQHLETMESFFNARSDCYDRVHTQGIDGGIESKRILSSFLPSHTETLLDIGIGTGLELEQIFSDFPHIKVTGIDIAEKMMDKLKEKYPFKEIELIRKNYFDYDYGNERFDAALSVMTLHHYTHPVKTALYRRIYDSLHKGGRYIECDYMISPSAYENPQAEEERLFSEYERLKQEQKLDQKGEYHFDTPCTVDNQIKMLQQSGFSSVRQVWGIKNTIVLIADKA